MPLLELKLFTDEQDSGMVSIYIDITEVSMMIANCNDTIIKNLFSKKTSGIEDILKFLW